ncbi:MAG: ethylbenzene dehydrogenase-related protein [Motiliproteus sp.]
MPITLSAAQVVPITSLSAAPVLDGKGSEWNEVGGVEIALRKTHPEHKTDVSSVRIKGGVYGDRVYFYLTWKDSTENTEHKPFAWNEQQGRYIQTTALEDRLALQFEMSGDYSTDWLAGNSFTADMWHWKAFRSNMLGLAHDKQTIISDKKLLRSYEGHTPQGNPVYILRPSDSGDRLYRSQRYRERQEDKMPKYVISTDPQGSITDIKANGVWREGAWHLEMSRQLNTTHADDVLLQPGQSVRGGVAIFDGTGDADHSVSDTLIFQF